MKSHKKVIILLRCKKGSLAATISSYHTCPQSTGTKAHVGAPIVGEY